MKPNSIPSAGTDAQKSNDVEDNNVSPFFAKPHVSGSRTLTAKVPPKFAQAVNDFYKDYNIRLIEISDSDERWYIDDMWKIVVVEGQKDDLIKLNKHCKKVAYGDAPYCR